LARRILAALENPVELPGGMGRVSASIGIALYPEDGEQISELLINADMAMYRAKEGGRNNLRFFREHGSDPQP